METGRSSELELVKDEEEAEQGEEDTAAIMMWLSRLRIRNLNSIISLPCSKFLLVLTESNCPAPDSLRVF